MIDENNCVPFGDYKYILWYYIMTKDEILNFIYFDPAGYGSVKQTYTEARKKNKSLTIKDVEDFIDKHVEQKQLRGYNSFIAHGPKEEYQVDLLFLPKKRFSYWVLYWGCYCYRYLYQIYYNNTNKN